MKRLGGWMDGMGGWIMDGWMDGWWVAGWVVVPSHPLQLQVGALGDGDRWLAREWAEIARFP